MSLVIPIVGEDALRGLGDGDGATPELDGLGRGFGGVFKKASRATRSVASMTRPILGSAGSGMLGQAMPFALAASPFMAGSLIMGGAAAGMATQHQGRRRRRRRKGGQGGQQMMAQPGMMPGMMPGETAPPGYAPAGYPGAGYPGSGYPGAGYPGSGGYAGPGYPSGGTPPGQMPGMIEPSMPGAAASPTPMPMPMPLAPGAGMATWNQAPMPGYASSGSAAPAMPAPMPGYASGYPAPSAVEVQAPPVSMSTPGGDFSAVVPGSDAEAGSGMPMAAPILPDAGAISFSEAGAAPAAAVGLPAAGDGPRIVDAVPMPEGGGEDPNLSPMATMEGLGGDGDGAGAGFQRIPWLLLGGLALGTWLLMRR